MSQRVRGSAQRSRAARRSSCAVIHRRSAAFLLGEQNGAAAVLRARGGAPPAVGARATRWKGSLNRLSHPRIFLAGIRRSWGFQTKRVPPDLRPQPAPKGWARSTEATAHVSPSRLVRKHDAAAGVGQPPTEQAQDGLRRLERCCTEGGQTEEERPPSTAREVGAGRERQRRRRPLIKKNGTDQ